MSRPEIHLSTLDEKFQSAALRVQTLGTFRVWRKGEDISSKAWGREKSIQLFQFLISARHRRGLHKEQIIDRLWPEASRSSGDRDFKVALHGIHKVLEPDRKRRTDARFIQRQGLTYQLNQEECWIDVDALENYIAIGNQNLNDSAAIAKIAYQKALALHQGIFLPTRLYEDWSSGERERLQILALGAMLTLAELELADNPMESIRLSQQALLIDKAWEDAYRIQMQAYFRKGNRPMALKTFQQCKKVLDEEFGIEPLPETKALFRKISEIK